MTVLTAVQVAEYWIGAGGPKSRAVEWVAIAIGESSLDDEAVSQAGAIGTWQIMPFNAAIGGGTVADLYDPGYNAKVAVIMSGGGVNCAAWDSCYANIQASGRYAYLGWPEVGSADYNNLSAASAELAGQGLTGTPVTAPPTVDDSLTAVVSQYQALGATQLPALGVRLTGTAQALSGMYRKGWRP